MVDRIDEIIGPIANAALQSTFVALNIEPEEDSEDEIDDSKEIQVEEALKLYQNALKLHSQGPSFYGEAEAAYKALFKSEIFTYPESISLSKQIDTFDDTEGFNDNIGDLDPGTVDLPAAGADEAPNTLNQILYLAYKNRGQYLLDWLKHELHRVRKGDSDIQNAELPNIVRQTVVASLYSLVEAVDRDETDHHLWRLISRLSYFLKSKRTARFCLEAVLDSGDADDDIWPEPQGLEESFAAEQLKILLRELGDTASESQLPAGTGARLLPSLKKHVDPCPFLPSPVDDSMDEHSLARLYERVSDRQEIAVPVRDWASVGKAMLLQITNISQGNGEPDTGTAYRIRLPPRHALQGSSDMKGISETGTTIISSPITEAILKRKGRNPSSEKPENETLEEFSPTVASDKARAPEVSEAMPASGVGRADTNHFHSFDDRDQHVPNENTVVATDGCIHALEPIIQESPRTMSLPTRKRSSEAAGLPEAADPGRSKSRRIKARVSVHETAAEDLTQYYEEQLREYTQADQMLFEFVGNLLSKMDANNLRAFSELKAAVVLPTTPRAPKNKSGDSLTVVIHDMKTVLTSWGIDKSTAFLKSTSHEDAFGGANGARNFNAFLESSKRGPSQISNLPILSGDEGLEDFQNRLEQNWFHLDQLAMTWIEELLAPRTHSLGQNERNISAYERFNWTSSLKEIVVQMLVQKDEYIYTTLKDRIQEHDQRLLASQHQPDPLSWGSETEALIQLIQNTFEIHVDVYERITNPSSEVDLDIRAMQRDRLVRWAALAHHAMSLRPDVVAGLDELSVRFLWSSVLFVNLTDDSARDHVILCFQDLKRTLGAYSNSIIKLQNNAAMPEVSVEAADREISCLTTMDFFLGIFNSEKDEPLSVIESLEPVLQSSVAGIGLRASEGDNASFDRPSNSGSTFEHPQSASRSGNPTGSQLEDMVRFFNKAGLTLKLFLWQRLGSAYQSINYPPQVLSCNLRRIELIVGHLQSSYYVDLPDQARQASLLGRLGDLEHILTATLSIALADPVAFEVVDMAQLRKSMAVMSTLQNILHVYIMWTDSVRVGQNTVSQAPRGSAASQFAQSMAKFDQMQVTSWMLQYMLLKEAIAQSPEQFEAPRDDSIDYLNLVHYTLGLRELCGLNNKRFLKLMKSEMLQFKASDKFSESCEWDFAQVIYDLYGIKICPSFANIRSHGCTAETVDRATALELMDYVLVQANRLSIKELAKSELKSTIDRMQQALKVPKSSNVTSYNKRAISHFLRSPVNPLDMYRALKGIGELSSITIENQFSAIADKGWYSLLGQMSLAKFRSQKRTIPGPLDDLDLAMTYFRYDLELGMEKWESWYRLAQVYDTKIEENTTWSADKINNGMEELKLLQRSAIHCYNMAVATATRSADASFEAVGKMAEMYADFATRIYASSREPFSMKAFGLGDFERHYSNPNEGMYKKRPFRDLHLYPAWSFASVLFRRALADKPKNWSSWYMLGKCLWKMYNCGEEVRGNAQRPVCTAILDALKRAIEAVPDRRDGRHPDREPVLEPHYKLVSVVHKLVQKGVLQVSEACSHLKATSYSRKVRPVEEQDDWEMYISQVLKALRSADKSNWHHRMLARVAHVIYDDSPNDARSALGAKHELTQQMFTKTMAIQVWRPDNERAGRHFVYTSRYVKFFVRLLYQLNDRTSLEALAKRIRKRSGDFLAHAEIWQRVCLTYLELLRRQGPVPTEHEKAIFGSIPYEIFALNAERLETWAHLPDTTSPLLDIIRDAIEIKKTNSNLMKVGVFEDLIGDTYAFLYEQIVPDLIAKSNDEEGRVRMRVDHVLMDAEASATATPPPDPNAKPGEAPVTRPRFKSATKREVQKRSEALVAKPAAALAAAKLAKPTGQAMEQGRTSGVAVVISRDEGGKEAASSVPGSVHDSADDESELSELEEFVDAPEKPVAMFPNLATNGEEEGDDEGEEDEGEAKDGKQEDEEEEEGAEEGDEMAEKSDGRAQMLERGDYQEEDEDREDDEEEEEAGNGPLAMEE